MGERASFSIMMGIFAIICCLQTACSSIAPSPTPTIQPSKTSTQTKTATPTNTASPTIIDTLTQTLTPTITITPSPTLTPTSIGGGSGLIAFHQWGGNSVDVFTYNLLDENIMKVTNLDSHEWVLNASPDGEWITFWVLSEGSERYDIGSLYIVRPDGRDLIKISDNFYLTTDNQHTYIKWSPHSKLLVFEEYEGYQKIYLTVFDVEKKEKKRITSEGYYPYSIMLISNDGWIFVNEWIDPGITIGALRVGIAGLDLKRYQFTENCEEFYCGERWTYNPIHDDIVFTNHHLYDSEPILLISNLEVHPKSCTKLTCLNVHLR